MSETDDTEIIGADLQPKHHKGNRGPARPDTG
jgi:hypothetical protein